MSDYTGFRRARALRCGLLLGLAALLLGPAGCGKGGGHRPAAPLPPGSCQVASIESAPTLQEELAELASMETPAGVDEALFARLKSTLAVELKRRLTVWQAPCRATGTESTSQARFASTPSGSEADYVDDLGFTDNGDGTYTLTWTYRNRGDYNQDGIVNVIDITPLAAHFNEETAPENEWVDGNGDGAINIQDLTTLAARFYVSVGRYRLEGARAEEGPFSEFASVSVEGEFSVGRRQLSYQMTGAPHAFVRVVPCDRQGIMGEPSNVLSLPGEAPAIAAVTPLAGTPGEGLTMHATVTGTEPLCYLWDFGSLGSPESSPMREPEIVLGEVGDYDCSLEVSNAFGQAVLPFRFTVAAEVFSISGCVTEDAVPLAGVSVALTPGDAGVVTGSDGAFSFSRLLAGIYKLTPSHPDYTFDPPSLQVEVVDSDLVGQDFAATLMTFSVSGLVTLGGGDPLPGVMVTIEPGGIGQETDAEGLFTFSDLRNGDYTLTPSLYGYGFTPPFVQLTIAGSDWTGIQFTGEVIAWGITTVDPGPESGFAVSLRMVDGRPAISYYESGGGVTGNLKLAINSEADGSGEWNISTIVSGVLLAYSFAVIDGCPAVCYYTSVDYAPDPLHFARNTEPDGSGTWPSYTVVTDVTMGLGVSMHEIDGRPAIAYYNAVDASTGSLRFTICDNSDGSGSWSPSVDVDATGHVGAYPFLTVLGTIPGITYFDSTNGDLKLALNEQPDASGTWQLQVPYSIGSAGIHPSMTMVDGRPAISFRGSAGLRYVINSEADASGAWRRVNVDCQDNVGSYSSLAVIGGFPAISYHDITNSSLKYAEAATAGGLYQNDWTCWTIDNEGEVGSYTSLMEVDGRPAIAYRDDSNGALKFALRPF